jgi:hypothetical protein
MQATSERPAPSSRRRRWVYMCTAQCTRTRPGGEKAIASETRRREGSREIEAEKREKNVEEAKSARAHTQAHPSNTVNSPAETGHRGKLELGGGWLGAGTVGGTVQTPCSVKLQAAM